jgi:hypothetical protein
LLRYSHSADAERSPLLSARQSSTAPIMEHTCSFSGLPGLAPLQHRRSGRHVFGQAGAIAAVQHRRSVSGIDRASRQPLGAVGARSYSARKE